MVESVTVGADNTCVQLLVDDIAASQAANVMFTFFGVSHFHRKALTQCIPMLLRSGLGEDGLLPCGRCTFCATSSAMIMTPPDSVPATVGTIPDSTVASARSVVYDKDSVEALGCIEFFNLMQRTNCFWCRSGCSSDIRCQARLEFVTQSAAKALWCVRV